MRSYDCCIPSNLASKQIYALSSILKLVSEPSRLQLLCILRQGEHCVCELVEHVDMSQSLVSHHLKDLKDGGIVVSKKSGPRVYYRLSPKGSFITNVLFQIPSQEDLI